MSIKRFTDFFPQTHTFDPSGGYKIPNKEILPYGVLYYGFSDTFINAFLPIAGDLVKVYVLSVIHAWDDILFNNPIEFKSLCEDELHGELVDKTFPSKRSAYHFLNLPERRAILKTRDLKDDVIVLYHHTPGVWWYFYLPMLLRSRQTMTEIGRFKTDKHDHLVLHPYRQEHYFLTRRVLQII